MITMTFIRSSLLTGLLILLPGAAGASAPCAGDEREIEPIAMPEPPYPFSASLYCIEGQVRLGFVVGTDGQVSEIEVLESQPPGVFDGSVEVVAQWQFRPACRDGEAAARSVRQTIEFSLPAAARQRCADGLDETFEALAIDLLTTRVALSEAISAEAGSGVGREARFEQLLSRYDGDARRVAEAHLDILDRELDIRAQFENDPEELGWVPVIFDGQIAISLGMDRARQGVARGRAFLDEIQGALQDHVDQSVRELGQLEQRTDLETGERMVLIDGLRETLRLGLEEQQSMFGLESEIFEQIDSLLSYLEGHEDDWHDGDGWVRFSDPDLRSEFEDRVESLEKSIRLLDRLHAEGQAFFEAHVS